METALIALALTALFAMPVSGADSTAYPQRPQGQAGGAGQGPGQGQNLEQMKSNILQRIDQRIARSQEEKVCVQSAKSHIEIKACRDRFRPPPHPNHQNGGRQNQTQ